MASSSGRIDAISLSRNVRPPETAIGNRTRVKVVKNKVAAPFREAEFDILYGEGISREGEVLEIGVLHGVLEKSGAWYIYNGDRLGQGKDNSREFLKENPALAKEIEAKIREKASGKVAAPAAEEAVEGKKAEDKKVEQLPTRKRAWVLWRLTTALSWQALWPGATVTSANE